MAVANQQGQLLLATATSRSWRWVNCTLYGDMNVAWT